MALPKNPDHRRLVWLSEEDRSAARRLLALLSGEAGPGSTARSATTSGRSISGGQALERANLPLYLRQRRVEILGRMFSTEAPFQMLVALYTNENRELQITVTRLTELAWLTPTTVLRWLDLLARDGWIARTNVAADRRRAQIGLTERARKALDELFAWPQ